MKHLFPFLSLLFLFSCSLSASGQETSALQTRIPEDRTKNETKNETGTMILIHTRLGEMKIRLYDDTPIHRDFMLSLIRKGYYDGSLFGRVLYGFIIQGGSEDSKGAPPGRLVGHGRSSMLLPPEIREHHIPKKGALAMPRQPDDVNPEKKTDASQIFIVQGRIYTPDELRAMEIVRNKPAKTEAMKRLYYPHRRELDSLKTADPHTYNRRIRRLNQQIDSLIRQDPNHLFFTPEEKEAYTTIGGSPHLRGEYTILGEVVEGLETIDKIAASEVDRNNRPLEDVVMSVKVLP